MFSAFQDLAAFVKARRGEMIGGKYLMRIPLGVDETGAPKYRYIYNVHHTGSYIHDDRFHVKNALIQGKHEGKEGHFKVKSSDDTHVTVHHSGSDKKFKVSREEFKKRLHAEHKSSIDQHRAHVVKTLKSMEESNFPGLKIQYAQYAAQYGVVYSGSFAGQEGESAIDLKKDEIVDKVAITLHKKILPEPTVKLNESITKFEAPTENMKEMFVHQIDGAERGLTSLDERDGFLLQDETGLGKTVTLTAISKHMQLEEERPHLVVTPWSGKKNHFQTWERARKLFGLEQTHWKDADDMSKPGNYVCAIDDVATTVKYIDPYTGRKAERIELKPEFQGKWGLITFDESHIYSKPTSKYAMAMVALQENADKCLYSSATAFTQLTDTHYLRKMGWFKDGDEFTKWAEKAGATIVRSNETNGALPYKITNPTSVMPLVYFSALAHSSGAGIRRQRIDSGTEHNFHTLNTADLTSEHLHTFEQAEKCREIAHDAGLTSFEINGHMTLWRKHMWEVSKLDTAIQMAKDHLEHPDHNGKSQATIFTEFINHGHNHLRVLSNNLRERTRKGELDSAVSAPAIAKIDTIIDSLPPLFQNPETGESETAAGRILRHFGGEDNVAQIHGETKLDSITEHQAFQDGGKRVLFGTAAKAGLGLGFHDTSPQGDKKRLQLNVSLPWSASAFQQLGGRVDRLGQTSQPEVRWLQGDSASEHHVSNIVGTKLRSMGAAVAGDSGHFVNSGAMQSWEFSTGSEDPHLSMKAREAEFNDAPPSGDAALEAERDNFKHGVDRYRAGGDPMAEHGSTLKDKRSAERYRQRRLAIAKLSNAGLKIHNHAGLRYRISGHEKGSAVDSVLRNIQRGASIDAETGDAIIHNPRVFARLTKELGVDKMDVDTPKDLTDNTLSELRQTAAESAKYTHLLMGSADLHQKALTFGDLIKSAYGVKHELKNKPIKRSRFSEFLDLIKGEVPIGTIHVWANGARMKKIDEGHWEEVLEQRPHPGSVALPQMKKLREAAAGKESTDEGKHHRPLNDRKSMGFWKKIAASRQSSEEEKSRIMGLDWEHPEWDRFPSDKVDPKDVQIFTKRDPGAQFVMSWKEPGSDKQQYTYSSEYKRRLSFKKWERTKLLFPILSETTKKFTDQFSDASKSTRERDAGAVMSLIAQSGSRVGYHSNFEKTGTRGALTLSPENIKIKGDNISLDFIGKDKVQNTYEVTDKKLAGYLKDRVSSAEADGFVFSCFEHDLKNTVRSATGHEIKQHDFRSVMGTLIAADYFSGQTVKLTGDRLKDIATIRSHVAKASKTVATQLNNTPAIARSSYIHPALVQAFIHDIGGGVLEKEFFKANGYKRFSELFGNKDAHSLINYGIAHWKPHVDLGPIHGRGHVEEPPHDADDSVLDGYLLPDVLH